MALSWYACSYSRLLRQVLPNIAPQTSEPTPHFLLAHHRHNRRHTCIRTVKQLRNLLQSWSLCLHEVEIYRQTFNDQYGDVDEVELPAEFFDADGIDVLVEDAGESGEAETQCQTFGTDLVREDLDCV